MTSPRPLHVLLLLLLTCPDSALAEQWQQVMQAEFTHEDSSTPPLVAEWRLVDLPDQWGATERWEQGLTGWYRIRLPNNAPKDAQAIYLQRISTNVRVFLNEQYVGSGGSLSEPVSRNMHRPLMFRLPESAWRPLENYVYVQLRVYPGYAHLGAARIGSEAAMRPVYERQFFIQNTLSLVVFAISMLCGLVALLLWFFTGRQSAILFFTLTTLSWSIYCLNLFIRDIPFSAEHWWAMIHANLEWACVWLFLFCHRLLNIKRFWLEFSVIGFAMIASVVYISIDLVNLNSVARAFHLGSLIIVMYTTGWLCVRFLRHKETAAAVVAICLMGIVVLGANDLVRQTVPLNSPDWQTPFYLLQFGAPSMFVILVGFLIWRYVTALSAEQSATANLATARAEERERIYQDLHDDLGAKLLSLVHRSSDPELKSVARQAMGDLRELVADTNESPESLSAVLLRLKLEIQERCEEAGLQSSVDHQISVDKMVSSEFTHHLTRVLRELLNNTLHHAQAERVILKFEQHDAALQVSYQDDGMGMKHSSSMGAGLPGIRRRAEKLGGRAEFSTDNAFNCLLEIPTD